MKIKTRKVELLITVYQTELLGEEIERLHAYLVDMKRTRNTILSVIAVVAFISPPLLHSFAGIGISPILSGSMRPYAQPGDIFITKNVKASSLKTGDIISVNSPEFGGFYAHRITQIKDTNGTLAITTKGDANSAPEIAAFNTSVNQLVPRNIYRVLWLGRPLVYLTSTSGKSVGYSFLIGANVLALFAFVFRVRKTIVSKAEGIYKSLYLEERARNEVTQVQSFGKRSYVSTAPTNQQEEM